MNSIRSAIISSSRTSLLYFLFLTWVFPCPLVSSQYEGVNADCGSRRLALVWHPSCRFLAQYALPVIFILKNLSNVYLVSCGLIQTGRVVSICKRDSQSGSLLVNFLESCCQLWGCVKPRAQSGGCQFYQHQLYIRQFACVRIYQLFYSRYAENSNE